MKTLNILFVVALAFLCIAGGKKPKITVRVHAEGNEMDTATFAQPITIQYPPYKIYIQQVPVFSEQDIVGVEVHLAANGSYGALLSLSPSGKLALSATSTSRPRTFLAVFVNGKQLETVFIDRPVYDGLFYIRQGLSQEDAELLQKKFNKKAKKGLKTPKLFQKKRGEDSLYLTEEGSSP